MIIRVNVIAVTNANMASWILVSLSIICAASQPAFIDLDQLKPCRVES